MERVARRIANSRPERHAGDAAAAPGRHGADLVLQREPGAAHVGIGDGRILSDALSGDGRRIAFAARAVHRDVQTADTVDLDGQIVRIPRHEQHDDTEQTFHRRRSKSGGMDVPEVGRLKELESGNARLERLIAGQPLVIDSLKEFS